MLEAEAQNNLPMFSRKFNLSVKLLRKILNCDWLKRNQGRIVLIDQLQRRVFYNYGSDKDAYVLQDTSPDHNLNNFIPLALLVV